MKISAIDPRVQDFYSTTVEKMKKRPSLYIGKKSITVVLPMNLIEFAEAAAGHSGYGTGARPVGIRRESDNPALLRDYYFSSPEMVAELLNSSNLDAFYHSQKSSVVKKKSKKEFTDDNVTAIDAIYKKYAENAFSILMNISKIFRIPTAELRKKFEFLTLNEVELMFGTRKHNFDLNIYK